jgi:hypothetical protein
VRSAFPRQPIDRPYEPSTPERPDGSCYLPQGIDREQPSGRAVPTRENPAHRPSLGHAELRMASPRKSSGTSPLAVGSWRLGSISFRAHQHTSVSIQGLADAEADDVARSVKIECSVAHTLSSTGTMAVTF